MPHRPQPIPTVATCLDCASCGRQITVEAPCAPCARLAALAMVLFGAVVFSIAAVLG
jgi:hypothetical protein